MATFTVNSLPVATLLTPNSASGKLAHMVMTAGSGWSSPRMQVSWSYSDAEGSAQSKYELEIATSTTPTVSGGSPSSTIVSGQVTSSATTVVPAPSSPYVESNYYHVRVRVNDGTEWGNYSGYFECRVRWALTTHAKDVNISGLAPTSWSVTALTTDDDGVNNEITLEYNSSDDGTTNLGSWAASLATPTKRKWVHYRAWFFAWGNSPATRAKFQDITIQTTGLVLEPDFWLPTPISGEGGTVELGVAFVGSQSIKMTGDGTEQLIRQQVRIETDTDYVLQGRIQSIGNSGASIRLSDTATGAALINSTPIAADLSPFTQQVLAPWNSGNRTTVWLQCRVNGSSSTAGFFDGLKMEKGRVASGWSPTYVGTVVGLAGSAAVVDAGGVQVDALFGGVFRLRGSDSVGKSKVELGQWGLELESDAAGNDTLHIRTTGDSNWRLGIRADGTLEWGSGSAGADTTLGRGAANRVDTGSGDNFKVAGGDLTLNDILLSRLSATRLSIGNVSLVMGGSSFPGSPTADDLYNRTDRDILYRYDGTRWLSEALYTVIMPSYVGLMPVSITTNGLHAVEAPFAGVYDLWLENAQAAFRIAGGTALSGSHKWVLTIQKQPANTTFTTLTIDSGASDAWRDTGQVSIGALLGTSNFEFESLATKTGTPGTLTMFPTISYRLVG